MDKIAKITVPNKKEARKERIFPNRMVTSSDPTDGEYLADIECGECSYKGKPASDGTCPNCGVLLGVKPQESDNELAKATENQTSEMGLDPLALHEQSSLSEYM
jgi:hypothetical protein